MGYDCNDLVRDQGPAAVRALLAQAAPPLPEAEATAAFSKPEPLPPREDYEAENSPPDPGPARATETQPAEDDEESIIGKRLAALSDVDYDRRRVETAEKLGVRVATLDKLRARFLPKEADALQGSAIDLYEPIPWPTPVNGAAVFEEVYH